MMRLQSQEESFNLHMLRIVANNKLPWSHLAQHYVMRSPDPMEISANTTILHLRHWRLSVTSLQSPLGSYKLPTICTVENTKLP